MSAPEENMNNEKQNIYKPIALTHELVAKIVQDIIQEQKLAKSNGCSKVEEDSCLVENNEADHTVESEEDTSSSEEESNSTNVDEESESSTFGTSECLEDSVSEDDNNDRAASEAFDDNTEYSMKSESEGNASTEERKDCSTEEERENYAEVGDNYSEEEDNYNKEGDNYNEEEGDNCNEEEENAYTEEGENCTEEEDNCTEEDNYTEGEIENYTEGEGENHTEGERMSCNTESDENSNLGAQRMKSEEEEERENCSTEGEIMSCNSENDENSNLESQGMKSEAEGERENCSTEGEIMSCNTENDENSNVGSLGIKSEEEGERENCSTEGEIMSCNSERDENSNLESQGMKSEGEGERENCSSEGEMSCNTESDENSNLESHVMESEEQEEKASDAEISTESVHEENGCDSSDEDEYTEPEIEEEGSSSGHKEKSIGSENEIEKDCLADEADFTSSKQNLEAENAMDKIGSEISKNEKEINISVIETIENSREEKEVDDQKSIIENDCNQDLSERKIKDKESKNCEECSAPKSAKNELKFKRNENETPPHTQNVEGIRNQNETDIIKTEMESERNNEEKARSTRSEEHAESFESEETDDTDKIMQDVKMAKSVKKTDSLENTTQAKSPEKNENIRNIEMDDMDIKNLDDENLQNGTKAIIFQSDLKLKRHNVEETERPTSEKRTENFKKTVKNANGVIQTDGTKDLKHIETIERKIQTSENAIEGINTEKNEKFLVDFMDENENVEDEMLQSSRNENEADIIKTHIETERNNREKTESPKVEEQTGNLEDKKIDESLKNQEQTDTTKNLQCIKTDEVTMKTDSIENTIDAISIECNAKELDIAVDAKKDEKPGDESIESRTENEEKSDSIENGMQVDAGKDADIEKHNEEKAESPKSKEQTGNLENKEADKNVEDWKQMDDTNTPRSIESVEVGTEIGSSKNQEESSDSEKDMESHDSENDMESNDSENDMETDENENEEENEVKNDISENERESDSSESGKQNDIGESEESGSNKSDTAENVSKGMSERNDGEAAENTESEEQTENFVNEMTEKNVEVDDTKSPRHILRIEAERKIESSENQEESDDSENNRENSDSENEEESCDGGNEEESCDGGNEEKSCDSGNEEKSCNSGNEEESGSTESDSKMMSEENDEEKAESTEGEEQTLNFVNEKTGNNVEVDDDTKSPRPVERVKAEVKIQSSENQEESDNCENNGESSGSENNGESSDSENNGESSDSENNGESSDSENNGESSDSENNGESSDSENEEESCDSGNEEESNSTENDIEVMIQKNDEETAESTEGEEQAENFVNEKTGKDVEVNDTKSPRSILRVEADMEIESSKSLEESDDSEYNRESGDSGNEEESCSSGNEEESDSIVKEDRESSESEEERYSTENDIQVDSNEGSYSSEDDGGSITFTMDTDRTESENGSNEVKTASSGIETISDNSQDMSVETENNTTTDSDESETESDSSEDELDFEHSSSERASNISENEVEENSKETEVVTEMTKEMSEHSDTELSKVNNDTEEEGYSINGTEESDSSVDDYPDYSEFLEEIEDSEGIIHFSENEEEREISEGEQNLNNSENRNWSSERHIGIEEQMELSNVEIVILSEETEQTDVSGNILKSEQLDRNSIAEKDIETESILSTKIGQNEVQHVETESILSTKIGRNEMQHVETENILIEKTGQNKVHNIQTDNVLNDKTEQNEFSKNIVRTDKFDLDSVIGTNIKTEKIDKSKVSGNFETKSMVEAGQKSGDSAVKVSKKDDGEYKDKIKSEENVFREVLKFLMNEIDKSIIFQNQSIEKSEIEPKTIELDKCAESIEGTSKVKLSAVKVSEKDDGEYKNKIKSEENVFREVLKFLMNKIDKSVSFQNQSIEKSEMEYKIVELDKCAESIEDTSEVKVNIIHTDDDKGSDNSKDIRKKYAKRPSKIEPSSGTPQIHSFKVGGDEKCCVFFSNSVNITVDDDALIWMVKLVKLYHLQLPYFSEKYLIRQVFDPRYCHIAVVKGENVLSAASFRVFPAQNFCELAFYGTHPDESCKGFASLIMAHLKEFNRVRTKVTHLVACVPEISIGYLLKLGFSTEITLPPFVCENYLARPKDTTALEFLINEDINYYKLHLQWPMQHEILKRIIEIHKKGIDTSDMLSNSCCHDVSSNGSESKANGNELQPRPESIQNNETNIQDDQIDTEMDIDSSESESKNGSVKARGSLEKSKSLSQSHLDGEEKLLKNTKDSHHTTESLRQKEKAADSMENVKKTDFEKVSSDNKGQSISGRVSDFITELEGILGSILGLVGVIKPHNKVEKNSGNVPQVQKAVLKEEKTKQLPESYLDDKEKCLKNVKDACAATESKQEKIEISKLILEHVEKSNAKVKSYTDKGQYITGGVSDFDIELVEFLDSIIGRVDATKSQNKVEENSGSVPQLQKAVLEGEKTKQLPESHIDDKEKCVKNAKDTCAATESKQEKTEGSKLILEHLEKSNVKVKSSTDKCQDISGVSDLDIELVEFLSSIIGQVSVMTPCSKAEKKIGYVPDLQQTVLEKEKIKFKTESSPDDKEKYHENEKDTCLTSVSPIHKENTEDLKSVVVHMEKSDVIKKNITDKGQNITNVASNFETDVEEILKSIIEQVYKAEGKKVLIFPELQETNLEKGTIKLSVFCLGEEEKPHKNIKGVCDASKVPSNQQETVLKREEAKNADPKSKLEENFAAKDEENVNENPLECASSLDDKAKTRGQCKRKIEIMQIFGANVGEEVNNDSSISHLEPDLKKLKVRKESLKQNVSNKKLTDEKSEKSTTSDVSLASKTHLHSNSSNSSEKSDEEAKYKLKEVRVVLVRLDPEQEMCYLKGSKTLSEEHLKVDSDEDSIKTDVQIDQKNNNFEKSDSQTDSGKFKGKRKRNESKSQDTLPNTKKKETDKDTIEGERKRNRTKD